MTTGRTADRLPTPGKIGLLGSLYFSQGFPYGFFFQALPVMMRQQGRSLEEIGLSSLLALPWAAKFLVSPLVDRHYVSRFGRRRTWIIPLQLAAAGTLLALSFLPVPAPLNWVMAAIFVTNALAATQDIATDGFAVDMLAVDERGLANGIQVAGYRVGMVVGGGVLLILHGYIGWRWTFLAMSILTFAATLPVVLASEAPGQSVEGEARASILSFLRRRTAPRILALVLVYKAGESFATGMLRPFLTDSGLTMEDVGWLLGTVGFAAGLVGAMVGGISVNRLGRRRSLVVFGAIQAITVLAYAWAASGHLSRPLLYVVCASEHFGSGTATAALFTCMMDWCRRGSNATDYTIQASAVVVAQGGAAAVSGFSAHALGYVGHFLLAAGLAAVALAVAFFVFPEPDPMEGAECVPPSTPETSTP